MAEQRTDAGYRVFHDRWNIQIPDIYTYSQKFIEEAGLVTSMDRETDRAMRMSVKSMYICIAGMAIYHEEGAPMRLTDPHDAVPIYEVLTQHLNDWKWVLETQLNIPEPPMKDLEMFDRFAAAVYPLAAQFTTRPQPLTGMFARIENMRSNRMIVAKEPNKPIQTEIPTKSQTVFPAGHTPIVDAIARRLRQQRAG